MTKKAIPKWTIKCVPAEFRSLVKYALSIGWRIRLSGDNHNILIPPKTNSITKPIVISKTPSDKRAQVSIISDFKKHGIDINCLEQ
jgi:hypothetical protein